MRESRIQIERTVDHGADQLALVNKLKSVIVRKGEVTSRESYGFWFMKHRIQISAWKLLRMFEATIFPIKSICIYIYIFFYILIFILELDDVHEEKWFRWKWITNRFWLNQSKFRLSQLENFLVKNFLKSTEILIETKNSD